MKGIILLFRKIMNKRSEFMPNQEVQNLEYKNSRNLEERYLLEKLFMGKK